MAQDDKKKLSGPLHISGTMYHMIVIYGTLMQNDDISRFLFHFFKIWILWVVRGRGVKGQKMKKWSKMRKNSTLLHISGIIHYMIFIYVTHI